MKKITQITMSTILLIPMIIGNGFNSIQVKATTENIKSTRVDVNFQNIKDKINKEVKNEITKPNSLKSVGLSNGLSATISVATAINSLFPDKGLSSAIADTLNKKVTDKVTQADLNTITDMDASSYNITNLQGIQYLNNVSILVLDDNNISDINLLSSLSNLVILSVSGNKVTNINSLSSLTKLEMLDLSYNNISDITSLTPLIKLLLLNMEGNNVNNITPLSSLTELSGLNLNSNKINDISTITKLTQLVVLELSSNSISDVSPLSSEVNLQTLYLDGNNISDITSLIELKAMSDLDLGNQKITLKTQVISDPLIISNPTKDLNGSVIEPSTISNKGIYDTQNITWLDLTNQSKVTSDFSKAISLGSTSSNFTGTITQPLTGTIAPVTRPLISDIYPDFTYIIGSAKTESDFIKDIMAKTNDGSAIVSNFPAAVNLNKVGNYVVTLNATNTAGAIAYPVKVTIHMVSTTVVKPIITGQAHVQKLGWMTAQNDSSGMLEIGTEGKSLRIEALKLSLSGMPDNATLQYQVHVQNKGWMTPVNNGALAGTTGLGLRVESIKISLMNAPLNYHVEYQAHVQNIGWMPWVSDGNIAGTTGKSLRVEAIRVKLVKDTQVDGLNYSSHVSHLGWTTYSANADMSGQPQLGRQVEAFELNPQNIAGVSTVSYSSLNVNGWGKTVNNGIMSGTTGQSKALYAIKATLDGSDKMIQYQVYNWGIGWSSWGENGDVIGDATKVYPIIAIRSRIIDSKNANNLPANIDVIVPAFKK